MALNVMQAPTWIAVVTGANKGIGLETVRKLSNAGVTVVLTARNENRGIEAMKLLHKSGLSNVMFHQLDVRDQQSIGYLAKFIMSEFEKLDILVNNAGASGVSVDEDGLRALNIDPAQWLAGKAVNVVQDVMITTYETAKECLDTNYYGVRNVSEALLPSLQLSTSGARIVNISSLRSELSRIPNGQIRNELGDIETLTEERIDQILQTFLHDLQEDALEANGWQKMLPAYNISKATLNAYTRVLAKKYPHMYINCVHPGYVNTDINWHTGTMTVREGAEGPVMLALLPNGVITGANKGIGFETVRQLAKEGVTVVLTARNETRGMEAQKLLQESGLPNVVFHQLDVRDPKSIESLAKFITTEFKRLDILVNNAGASGVAVDKDGLRALSIDPGQWLAGKATNMVQDVMKTTYETATECLDTNYYGVRNVTEALLPSLKLSTSGARIVNISSLRSELCRIPNEQIRNELGDIQTLTEERIDQILQKFLYDLQEDALEVNGWQKIVPAYSISKATLNAYTRVLAKKCPHMYVNCVHPGYVNTDLNWHTGTMSVKEGAEGPVMLALLPDGGPTGHYFDRTQLAEF